MSLISGVITCSGSIWTTQPERSASWAPGLPHQRRPSQRPCLPKMTRRWMVLVIVRGFGDIVSHYTAAPPNKFYVAKVQHSEFFVGVLRVLRKIHVKGVHKRMFRGAQRTNLVGAHNALRPRRPSERGSELCAPTGVYFWIASVIYRNKNNLDRSRFF